MDYQNLEYGQVISMLDSNKKTLESSNKTVLFFVIFILCGVGSFFGFAVSVVFLGIIEAICSIFFLILFISQVSTRNTAKKEIKKLQPIYNELNQKVMDGTYPFQSRIFYNKCTEAGLKALDDPYSFNKAKQIAKDMLRSLGFPEYVHEKYLADERIKTYYAEGRQDADKQKMQEEKKEEQRISENRKGRKAELDDNTRKNYYRDRNLLNLTGVKKREQMLADEIADNDRAAEYWGNLHSAKATAIINGPSLRKAYGQKEKNWGIAGGIAEGLAGPAAGVAAAVDTINQNQQIKAYNQSLSKMDAGMMMNQLSSITYLYENEEQHKKKAIELRKEENLLAQGKVVIEDFSAEQLFSGIKIEEKTVYRKDEIKGKEYLLVKVRLKSDRERSLPADAKLVVDGCLTADVLLEGKKVASTVIPLPIFGVACGGNAETVFGICDNYIETEKTLEVVLQPARLWIMER